MRCTKKSIEVFSFEYHFVRLNNVTFVSLVIQNKNQGENKRVCLFSTLIFHAKRCNVLMADLPHSLLRRFLSSFHYDRRPRSTSSFDMRVNIPSIFSLQIE